MKGLKIASFWAMNSKRNYSHDTCRLPSQLMPGNKMNLNGGWGGVGVNDRNA